MIYHVNKELNYKYLHVKDGSANNQRALSLFVPLPSGKRVCSIKSGTTHFCNSTPPEAVREP